MTQVNKKDGNDQRANLITQAGPPVKSLSKLIGQAATGICHNQAVDHARLQAPSFIANLKYIEKLNKIEIVVQIPHEDGLLPLISTEPMNHIDYLLNSRMYQEQHICSNVHLAKNDDSTTGFVRSENKPGSSGFSLPYQLNSTLRSSQTVRLYKHLNLKTCIWKFKAYYDMSELVEKCNGKISTKYHYEQNDQSLVSVTLPLYVSYIYTADSTSSSGISFYNNLLNLTTFKIRNKSGLVRRFLLAFLFLIESLKLNYFFSNASPPKGFYWNDSTFSHFVVFLPITLD